MNQIEVRYMPEQVSCECGEGSNYRFRRGGKVLTIFGRVSYQRGYYLCNHCRRGHYPLDQRLGIRPGEVSPLFGSHLARLGAQTSFDEAKALTEALLLVEVSPTTIHKETLRFGRLQTQREAEWQHQSQDADHLLARQRGVKEAGKPLPKRLYGSLDGVMAPVDAEWNELKVGCWYTTTPSPSADQGMRIENVSYYCDFQQAKEFGDLVWATGCQRDADLVDEVVFVADGATWIWNLVAHHFPAAVQIVDWYHAVAYLTPVANAAYPQDEKLANAWRKRVEALLWQGKVPQVITACRRLARRFPNAAEPTRTATTFYNNHAKRLRYAYFRKQGYLIGSGTVESGCKQIGTFRLKRAGARWSPEGARLTAKARAAYLSGDWTALSQRRARPRLAA